jgi:hypothetical protein
VFNCSVGAVRILGSAYCHSKSIEVFAFPQAKNTSNGRIYGVFGKNIKKSGERLTFITLGARFLRPAPTQSTPKNNSKQARQAILRFLLIIGSANIHIS